MSPPGHVDAITSAATAVSVNHHGETVVVDLSQHVDLLRALAKNISDSEWDLIRTLPAGAAQVIAHSPWAKNALKLTLAPSDAWTLGEAIRDAADFIIERDEP